MFSSLKRAIGYVWPKRQKPMKRTPLSPGKCSLKRGNLQRGGPMRKRSKKWIAAQRGWSEITRWKVEQGMGCANCGQLETPYVRLEGHHYKTRGQGGLSTIDNHVLICPCCHRFIHENPIEAAKVGLIHSSKAGLQ